MILYICFYEKLLSFKFTRCTNDGRWKNNNENNKNVVLETRHKKLFTIAQRSRGYFFVCSLLYSFSLAEWWTVIMHSFELLYRKLFSIDGHLMLARTFSLLFVRCVCVRKIEKEFVCQTMGYDLIIPAHKSLGIKKRRDEKNVKRWRTVKFGEREMMQQVANADILSHHPVVGRTRNALAHHRIG